MSNEVSTAAEWLIAVVDLTDNDTEVYAGSCLLRGILVTTALSAHACPIKNGGTSGTSQASIPASAGIGTWVECGDQRFDTTLHVDPDDSGTGIVTVVYKPYHDGSAGTGAGLP